MVFIPGNHDAAARMLVGTTVAHIRVEREHVHTAADGRRYLLLHGDACDPVTTYHRWLAVLGYQHGIAELTDRPAIDHPDHSDLIGATLG